MNTFETNIGVNSHFTFFTRTYTFAKAKKKRKRNKTFSPQKNISIKYAHTCTSSHSKIIDIVRHKKEIANKLHFTTVIVICIICVFPYWPG